MNVVAGILIGVFNDTWAARLVIPLVWGVVFCLYELIFKPQVLERHRERAGASRWGLPPIGTFFLIEYLTAAMTALAFSAIAGFIVSLF